MHKALRSYLLIFSENRLLLFSHPSPNNSEQKSFQIVSDFVYWTNIIQDEYNVSTNKCTATFWCSWFTGYLPVGHSSPVIKLHQNIIFHFMVLILYSFYLCTEYEPYKIDYTGCLQNMLGKSKCYFFVTVVHNLSETKTRLVIHI